MCVVVVQQFEERGRGPGLKQHGGVAGCRRRPAPTPRTASPSTPHVYLLPKRFLKAFRVFAIIGATFLTCLLSPPADDPDEEGPGTGLSERGRTDVPSEFPPALAIA